MRPGYPVKFLLAALLVLATVQARGLDPSRTIPQYTQEIWTAEDGLPQNSVQALIQDRIGYLWIGTQEGLVRFDGNRFTVFDTGNTPGLRSGDVRAVLQDRGGHLWVGTHGGGLTCLFQGGGSKTFTVREGLVHDQVLCLAEDRRGAIWVGTEGGISILEGDRLRTWAPARDIPDKAVKVLRADASGALWVGTGDGLFRIDGERVDSFSKADGLLSAEILGITVDSHETIWVCTRGGLHRFLGGRFASYTRKDGLPHDIVWTALEDRDGNLWVGTSAGLCRFKPGACENFGVKDGLSYDLAWNLLEDAEGSLWVGTSSFGLNRFKDGKFITYGEREGLSAEYAWCVLQDRSGALWVGTDLGGLNRIEGGKVTTYGERDGLCYVEVGSLCEDRRGALWIGTPRGISKLEAGRFTSYGERDGLANTWIRTLVEDREGTVWAGTHGGGLARWTGSRFSMFTTADGLSSNYVRTILQDRAGDLWVGTNGGGLSQIRGGKVIGVYTKAQGLPSDFVYSLHEDAGGVLWIGTAGGGLCRFKSGRFATVTTREGLFNDLVFRILEDDAGRLWMSCNKGIFSVARKDLDDLLDGKREGVTCDVYGRDDGMRSSECNGGLQPSGWKGADGRLWFPTIRGVVVVDPARLRKNLRPPNLVVEEVLADGKPIPAGKRSILPAGVQSVAFRYTALSLQAPSKVRFRYRLEGLDPGWTETGERRTASYANLPPGDYVFRVTACNDDGVWSEVGAATSFRKEPRVYQTWAFRTGVALAAVLALYGLWRLRLRALRGRQMELEHQVEERTAQLEEANRELERLAHIDSLTGLANHRALHGFLDREWRRAARGRTPLALLMADLDFFKHFNDTYGHLEGDECLRRTGEVLRRAVRRPTDLAARWGGEEFAVVLAETGLDGAVRVAEDIRLGVEGLAMPHSASSAGPVVTISLGVAVARPAEGGRLDAFLAAADEALYVSKRNGRNRVTAAGPTADGVAPPKSPSS